jgi:hypothetical protein
VPDTKLRAAVYQMHENWRKGIYSQLAASQQGSGARNYLKKSARRQ